MQHARKCAVGAVCGGGLRASAALAHASTERNIWDPLQEERQA